MSIVHLPDSLRFGVIAGTIECERCDREEVYSIQGKLIEAEELMSEVYHDAGFDEDGYCAKCATQHATEEKGDARRQELKVL